MDYNKGEDKGGIPMNEFLEINDLPNPLEWNEYHMHQALGSCLCNSNFTHLAPIIKHYIPEANRNHFIEQECNPDEFENDAAFIEMIS